MMEKREQLLRFSLVLMTLAFLVAVFSIPAFFGTTVLFSPEGELLDSFYLEEIGPEPIEPTCTPSIEICDGIDNDCDDLVDEEGVCEVGVEIDGGALRFDRSYSYPSLSSDLILDPSVIISRELSGDNLMGCTTTRNSEGKIETCFGEKVLNFVQGEIIIKFSEDTNIKTESDAQNYLISRSISNSIGSSQSIEIQSIKRVIKQPIGQDAIGLDRIFKLKINDGLKTLDLVKEYEKDSGVEYAEPNFIYRIQNNHSNGGGGGGSGGIPPNDPRFNQQWAHDVIDSLDAWEIERGNPNIVIAILDTGVDYNHEDLADNIWINENEIPNNGIDDDNNSYVDDVRGYDFVNVDPSWCHPDEDCESEDNDPIDFHGHGTHVSGISAAVTNNSIGIAGVCQNCKIMPIRAGWLDSNGIDGGLMTEDIIQGIYYAANNGADVISMSFGGGESQAQKDALDYAYNNGVVLVAAAGNGNSKSKSWPAAYDNVISVSATDSGDFRAWFSQYGSWVDVAAPGVSILSTLPNNNYASWSGTSMSTPHVAGLAGLILSKNPGFTNGEVKNILRTGIDIPSNADQYIGTGRINSYKSIQINSIPIANLNSSLDDAVFSGEGVIDIIGTASGTNFVNYTIKSGLGIYPSSFNLLLTSLTSVENNVLDILDTLSIADGIYTIKLTSKNSDGQISEDKAIITINNNEILYPLSNDIYKAGSLIEITATIRVPFTSLIIEYDSSTNPTGWSSDGITIINFTPPVNNKDIATWDTNNLIANPDYYNLRITMNTRFGQDVAHINDIYLDPALKEGWPRRIISDAAECPSFFPEGMECSYWVGELEPTISDINNDNKKEVVIYSGGNPPKLHVFDENGFYLNGWPVEVGTSGVGGGNIQNPIIVDLDHDGNKEILVETFDDSWPSNQYIYAFNHDGSIRNGWPVVLPLNGLDALLLAEDINIDGFDEIIVYSKNSWNQTITIIDHNGDIINWWLTEQMSHSGSIEPTPTVGNFDDDPELEIVVVSPSKFGFMDNPDRAGVVYVYNMDGSIVEGWPVYTPGFILSSPSVGDINNDGRDEIVIGLMYSSETFPDFRYGGLYVFDRNGNILPGWPFMKGYNFWSTPSLGDLDLDGDLEIGISRLGFDTFVLHHDSTLLDGWPQSTVWNSYYSSIIADVDGDNKADILETSGSGFYPSIFNHGGVYAWDSEGNIIESFPKVTESDAQAPSAVSDLDGDGIVEIIASSDWDSTPGKFADKKRGSVYVWEVGNYNSLLQEWPQFHHDEKHSGLYTNPNPLVCGDLNLDNVVFDLSDLIQLQKIILSNDSLPAHWRNGDVDGNRILTEEDHEIFLDFITNRGDIPTCEPYVCGDADGSGRVNIADVLFLIKRIFEHGPPPIPNEAGDANGDGRVNIADVTYLIARIFTGGAAPVCPSLGGGDYECSETETVSEGETNSVLLSGVTYDVFIMFIDSSSIIFNVNGGITKSLSLGQTYKLSTGMYIGVISINFNNIPGGISSVDFVIGPLECFGGGSSGITTQFKYTTEEIQTAQNEFDEAGFDLDLFSIAQDSIIEDSSFDEPIEEVIEPKTIDSTKTIKEFNDAEILFNPEESIWEKIKKFFS